VLLLLLLLVAVAVLAVAVGVLWNLITPAESGTSTRCCVQQRCMLLLVHTVAVEGYMAVLFGGWAPL
jgi:hypothetical protein